MLFIVSLTSSKSQSWGVSTWNLEQSKESALCFLSLAGWLTRNNPPSSSRVSPSSSLSSVTKDITMMEKWEQMYTLGDMGLRAPVWGRYGVPLSTWATEKPGNFCSTFLENFCPPSRQPQRVHWGGGILGDGEGKGHTYRPSFQL